MLVKFKNNAKTKLSANINNIQTTVSVVDDSVFPTIVGSEYFTFVHYQELFIFVYYN
jgi:hypothetical protein